MKITKFIDNDKISRTTITTIFEYANKFLESENQSNYCIGKTMCNAFFEPNYESDMQFEIAMNKLGGKVIQHDKEKCFNSGIESFEDSIKTIRNYCDMIVLSYSSFQSIKNISKNLPIPIINAGCDKTKDMIQSIVDLYTLYKNFDIENEILNVLCIGNLHDCLVTSFIKILGLYPNIHTTHIEQWDESINSKKYQIVYYCQKTPSKETFDAMNGIEKNLDRISIIMHPNNNNTNEIYDIIEKKSCSVFSEQKNLGIYVRMSLIYTVLFNLLDSSYDTLEYNYLNQLQSEIHHW